MSARAFAIAVGSALVALQMPLCALACADAAGVHASVERREASIHSPPCHSRDDAPAPAPDGDSGSHVRCACAGHGQVLPGDTATPSRSLGLGWSVTVAFASPPRASLAPRSPAAAVGLPPPDILLLCSTLLI